MLNLTRGGTHQANSPIAALALGFTLLSNCALLWCALCYAYGISDTQALKEKVILGSEEAASPPRSYKCSTCLKFIILF